MALEVGNSESKWGRGGGLLVPTSALISISDWGRVEGGMGKSVLLAYEERRIS